MSTKPSPLKSPAMRVGVAGVAVRVTVAVGVTVGVTVMGGVALGVSVGRAFVPQIDEAAVGKEKPTGISKRIRQAPVCWMPSKNRTSTLAPGASGVASETVPTDMLELNPPPNCWVGGCSSVVPWTVRGPPLVVTTMADEVIGRRSAIVDGAGKVVRSM